MWPRGVSLVAGRPIRRPATSLTAQCDTTLGELPHTQRLGVSVTLQCTAMSVVKKALQRFENKLSKRFLESLKN